MSGNNCIAAEDYWYCSLANNSSCTVFALYRLGHRGKLF